MKTTFPFVLSGALALLLFWGSMAQADLVYAFNAHTADQNGHTFSGTITTTDSAINDGYLVSNEIVGWNWSIVGTNSSSVSSTDSGATLFVLGEVQISANDITLGQPNIMSDDTYGLEIGSNTGGRVVWSRSEFFGSFTEVFQGASAWSTFSPGMSGTDPWLVASRVTAVPEPGLCSALLGLVGLTLARRRRSPKRI